MRHAIPIILLVLSACTTSYKRDFPSGISDECYGALHYAEAATGKESKGDWTVITVPGEKVYMGMWHFHAPDGLWCGGWTSGNGNRTYLPTNPSNEQDFSRNALIHEAGHHVLLSNGVRGHPAEYKSNFYLWED